MTNPYFTVRKCCPTCESIQFNEIYLAPYLSENLKKYLLDFYSLQGEIDFNLLENATYSLCRCMNCQTIFQKNIPGDYLQTELYSKWINPDVISNIRRFYPLSYFQNLSNELVNIIALFSRPPSTLRFLDFGMGWGDWALLTKAYGVQSYGTEISIEQINKAKSCGINITKWEDIPNNNFDFINTEQVLEHVSQPLDTIRHLKSGLANGGIIKISVPYFEDIDRRLKLMDWSAPKGSENSLNAVAPLEHINYFKFESIEKMAYLSDLKVIHKRPYDNYVLLQKNNNSKI